MHAYHSYYIIYTLMYDICSMNSMKETNRSEIIMKEIIEKNMPVLVKL